METKTPTLGKILSIGGKPGLYKMVAQAKNGIIVESIVDQKRFQAFTHDKVSSLDEISVFTQTDEKPLQEIFKLIHTKTNGGPAPDAKAESPAVMAFFEEILPDYDREKVYVSHMKKIYGWYNLLLEYELLHLEDDKPEENPEEAESNDQPLPEAEKTPE